MKKSNILKCLSALLILGGSLVMTSCGGTDNPTTSTPTNTSETTDTESKIKSITANEDTVNIKMGRNLNLKNCYKINPVSGKTLSSSETKVTYTVTPATVATVVSSSLKPVAPGECTVTVTSKVDETKSCSFKVVVKDVYFDSSLSQIDSRDDLEKELIADGGTVRTSGSTSGELVVKDINATKWYAETTFVFHSTIESEKFPKMGIFATTGSNTSTPNQVYFFLNAAIGDSGTTEWRDFGVCEVENKGNWAWNEGVTNTTARHVDNAYTSATAITYETEVKMAVLRNGLDFHVFVNDEYRFTITTLETLFMNDQNEVAKSHVGFFQFNSDVTFKDYGNTTADETVVDQKLAALPTEKNVPEWAAD